MDNLNYGEYNNKNMYIRGDKVKFGKILKNIGARWNSRMKGGEGWLLPYSKEEEFLNLIKIFKEKEENLNKIEQNIKSIKEQTKYIQEPEDELEKFSKHPEEFKELYYSSSSYSSSERSFSDSSFSPSAEDIMVNKLNEMEKRLKKIEERI